MPIFRLNVTENDFDNAELDIAQKADMKFEKHLENWLENSPWALIQDELLLWVSRQPSAKDEQGTIHPDLLGIDTEGNLVIVEFKRRRTPREVVAQLLEYAAWANELCEEQIQEIADAYFQTQDQFQGKTFSETFCDKFETDEVPQLNKRLRLFIVAGEISARVLSVCRLLRSSYKMDVSCLEVSMFQTESEEVIIDIEDKLEDEVPTIPRPDGPKKREVVWGVILELIGSNLNSDFMARDVIDRVLEKDPECNKNTINGQINHFRISKQRVVEALQELSKENTSNEFPLPDKIVENVLQNYPKINQTDIRYMIDIFRQSKFDLTQLNQAESVTENPT